ncbi:DUF4360 domain-containing protein [Actinomadura decatromicini]|uniref:DUF4360 domain-containing protein n=1 Tax=Actinomadura decatromicini TaxID=2604572 RepID=A0A5D3F3Z1_9ACTN|nr:DUF4360 domain-containing protein [Actinomadura decatromicini]TYK42779.1 DUF4360 domain-containing protein [Actinomadura decatromicini]
MTALAYSITFPVKDLGSIFIDKTVQFRGGNRMRRGIALSAAAAAALALTAASVAPAAASAPPITGGPADDMVEITAVHGSGCAPDKTAASLKWGKDAFVIDYRDYTAQTGGSWEPIDARKNCQLAVKVTARENLTYAISQVDYRLNLNLQAGATAALKAEHNFLGSDRSDVRTFNMSGPFNGPYQITETVPITDLVWKVCGDPRPIGIYTELRVATGTSDHTKVSSISMNSPDGAYQTTYHLIWKECL